jgi:hypothetical protein
MHINCHVRLGKSCDFYNSIGREPLRCDRFLRLSLGFKGFLGIAMPGTALEQAILY